MTFGMSRLIVFRFIFFWSETGEEERNGEERRRGWAELK